MPLRVGLVGAGHIGGAHARAIRGVIRRELADAEYVAVADREIDRARRFAELAALRHVFADGHALIGHPEVDAVYVCTPTREHRELVLHAARAGKAIFSEKPLAVDLATAREMTAAVQAAGVTNQVGLVLRFSPILTVLKDLTGDARLGRPMALIFRDDQFFPIQGHYASAWRKDVALAGGGALIEHSIHDLDLLRWLLGEPEWLRAETRNYAGHAGIEDLAHVTLGYDGGCVATLVSIWHNVLSRPSLRRIEVFFENGYFTVDHDFLGPIRMHTSWAGPAELSEAQVLDRYFALAGIEGEAEQQAAQRWSLQDLAFLRAAAAHRLAFPDFAVALRAHELVDAVYHAAATRTEIRFSSA
ncbi:MAG TPA: Gfo/Idh/MocA family oxidoreductase [Dehalococcoidia bacterium]|nr:Gfo/Idh/MocA family oxidoreductase [Dehalococcoidia bacterium]